MGIGPRFSSSSYDKVSGPVYVRPSVDKSPNPNPKNYQFIKTKAIGKHDGLGNYMVMEVLYPDCTNYEGRKILVYENVSVIQIVHQGSLDPHFSENPMYISPIARFEPTKQGWKNAVDFALMMAKKSLPKTLEKLRSGYDSRRSSLSGPRRV